MKQNTRKFSFWYVFCFYLETLNFREYEKLDYFE